MNHACTFHGGASRERDDFKITLSGYNKRTDTPVFIVTKKGKGKQKFKVFFLDEVWFCKETKINETVKLYQTCEDTPDLDRFFKTDGLNILIDQLFDLIDREMIESLIYNLGSRSYKMFGGLEDPSIECIQQVGDLLEGETIPNVIAYWKNWLDMCRVTCSEDERYEQADTIWRHYFGKSSVTLVSDKKTEQPPVSGK